MYIYIHIDTERKAYRRRTEMEVTAESVRYFGTMENMEIGFIHSHEGSAFYGSEN